jgi:hypothetical protein
MLGYRGERPSSLGTSVFTGRESIHLSIPQVPTCKASPTVLHQTRQHPAAILRFRSEQSLTRANAENRSNLAIANPSPQRNHVTLIFSLSTLRAGTASGLYLSGSLCSRTRKCGPPRPSHRQTKGPLPSASIQSRDKDRATNLLTRL